MKARCLFTLALSLVTIWMFGQSGTLNGHEYVNLGLSVKWATCNVGASRPEQCGTYYAWGETAPKYDYSCDNYFYAVDNEW